MDWQTLDSAPKSIRSKGQGPLVELKLSGGTIVFARHIAPSGLKGGNHWPIWGGWQRVDDGREASEPMNDRVGLQPIAWRPLP